MMRPEQIQNAVTDVREEYVKDLFDYIDDRQKALNTKRRMRLILIAAAAAAFLAVSLSLFFTLRQNDPPTEEEPAATVYIEAEGCLAINVDKNRDVLSITSADGDGTDRILSADYIGKAVNEAITSIVNKSIKEGYAAGGECEVLLTVQSKDESVEERLNKDLEEWMNRDITEKELVVLRYRSDAGSASEIALDKETALDLALQEIGARESVVSYSTVSYRESSNTYRVYLQLTNGREYHIIAAAEDGELLVAWQREALLQKEQIDAIINKDLDRTEGACLLHGGGLNGTRVVCETGYSGLYAVNYLLDRRTGEILYKETVPAHNMISGDFSARAAVLVEKDEGAGNVLVMGIERISNVSCEYKITLLSDERTVVRRVLNGVVAE